MTMKITAAMELVPFKRPRFNGRKVFNDPRYTACKDALGLIARKAMNGARPMSGAIKISVTVCRNIKPDSRNYGDADNHLKTVLDALNGVCYRDDSQVTQAEITLQQGAPSVTITLEEIT